MYLDTFNAENDVKQGANISPMLFCIYIDCLLRKLQDSGVGCLAADNFEGALAYNNNNKNNIDATFINSNCFFAVHYFN